MDLTLLGGYNVSLMVIVLYICAGTVTGVGCTYGTVAGLYQYYEILTTYGYHL